MSGSGEARCVGLKSLVEHQKSVQYVVNCHHMHSGFFQGQMDRGLIWWDNLYGVTKQEEEAVNLCIMLIVIESVLQPVNLTRQTDKRSECATTPR